jgi:para-aminobenzoate synthetase component 1
MDELLARLGNDEHNITTLGASNNDGWQPTVAWNPVDTCIVPYDELSDPSEIIEKFVTNQRRAGRLVIGYVSYDLGCMLHRVDLTTDDDFKTPLAYMTSFDNWLSWLDGVVNIHAKDPSSFNTELIAIMERPARSLPAKLYNKGLSPAWSRSAYDQAYRTVHDYIEAGDIYQANLTHRLEGTSQANGLDIYRTISRTSHANFQSYIAGPDFEIISASPERFIKVHGSSIETSPIKGTRPRGDDDSTDEALRLDLWTNPKDKAELDMITDLMRNDLGVISNVGSVRVAERRVLTAYPTLWHAHSTIAGQLRSDISPIAALLSLMPGGSITGCPKKRAMEIIDEVENKRRGIYTGSIFTINPDGTLDSNIAIRTMIKKAEHIYLSVGGGIVYDSTQNDEYNESLQKAAAFLNI